MDDPWPGALGALATPLFLAPLLGPMPSTAMAGVVVLLVALGGTVRYERIELSWLPRPLVVVRRLELPVTVFEPK